MPIMRRWTANGVKEEPEEVTEYMVADSNLSKCVSRYGSMESERTVEASSTLNNMNIDYLYAQWLGNGDEFLLCIAGKRYRNPAREHHERGGM